MGSDRPHLDPEPERLRKAAADLRLMYGADTGASVRLDRAAARIAELEAALSAEKAKVAEAVRERDEARAERDKRGLWERQFLEAVAAREAAEAEAARLREALEPFANACGELFNDWCPDETPAWWSDDEPSTLAVGDFRKARAALGGDHG